MVYNSFVPRPLNTQPSTLTLIHLITCDTKYIMYMSVCPLSYTQFPFAHSMLYCCVSYVLYGVGKLFFFQK